MSAQVAFDVLSEPSRRGILDLLLERERSVGELVEAMPLSQPGVSRHLRVMREAGLVTVRIDGQRRWYGVDATPLRDLETWLAPYRRLWSSSLDALQQHLDSEDED